MGKLQDLDNLDRHIKDSEIKLKSIQSAVERIDHEIAVLEPLKTQLEENIAFLKNSGTIPIAHEFRKVKQELTKTKTRLGMISSDRTKSMEACKSVEQVIEKFKRDYQAILIASEHNVLKGKFGRKNGQNRNGS